MREERTLMVERERESLDDKREERVKRPPMVERRDERERETLDDKRILIIIKKTEYEYLNKIKGRIDNLFF